MVFEADEVALDARLWDRATISRDPAALTELRDLLRGAVLLSQSRVVPQHAGGTVIVTLRQLDQLAPCLRITATLGFVGDPPAPVYPTLER